MFLVKIFGRERRSERRNENIIVSGPLKTSQSLVVYKINCKTCNVDFLGKTERILVHRLKEHQKKKQTTNKSACYEHIEENPTHEMDYENIQFQIKNEGTITYSERTTRIK